MSLTSLIRVRQIASGELSAFVSGVIPSVLSSTGITIGGSILPSFSGIFNVGSQQLSYNSIFTNNITLPSGSGIMFGQTPLYAYTSGGYGVVNVGGYSIVSNNQFIGILGAQGPSGLQGLIGSTGISGIGVTGYSNINNNLILYYSNGSSGNPIPLPTGKTGATGAYTTGFVQSGNYLSPIFSNGSTGSSFYIPSGGLGPQGPIGNIYIDMGSITGFKSGDIAPYVNINYVNPSITENPPLNLVKGMNYGFGYSGLNTLVVSGYNTNYFIDDYGKTGYLQLVFFNGNQAIPGRYLSVETTTGYSTVYNWLDNAGSNNVISSNKSTNSYLNQLSMNVNFQSDSNYYYGFQRYLLANQQPIDDGSVNDNPGEWGFYVLGKVNCNYFGPQGPSGLQGNAGVPGPQGEVGPPGNNGNAGNGITGVNYNGYQIQLLYSDYTTSQWLTLPTGGPSGSMGLQGPQGISGMQGSTGPQGPTGAQGIADTYYTEFYPNNMVISGITGFFKEVGGVSPYIPCTGTGMVAQVGDVVYFTTPSLVGKSYSPWQSILVADNNFYNARYFYASVLSFNGNNGAMQFVVNSTPSPAGLVGGYIQLYNYSLINMNLGGLGSSGAQGPQGIQGPMGNTGYSIFINTGTINLPGHSSTNIYPGAYDCWNFGLTGELNTLNIISSNYSTGQTLMIKIINTGAFTEGDYSNHSNPLLQWSVDGSSGIKFPNGVPAGAPIPNTSSTYTLQRFPDLYGQKQIFMTYAVNFA